MTRNKFGLPLIFDYVKLTDDRRLKNLEKMKYNCPKGWEKMWSVKLDQLRKNIHDRKRKTLN
tara:strand:- start:26 stop:211 length:186 start_codon:yes stop_codon:yes gene_type:complete